MVVHKRPGSIKSLSNCNPNHHFTTTNMASPRNYLSLFLSVLTLSTLMSSVFSEEEPQERIVGGTMFPYETKSIAAIVLQLSIPDNATWYYTYCTASLVARNMVITSDACLSNARAIAAAATINEYRQLMVIIGHASTATPDVEAEGVIMNNITDANVITNGRFMYNPSADSVTNDVVIIKLDTPAADPTVFYPFSIATGNAAVNATTSMFPPFLLSWGQSQCMGFAAHDRNYAIAQTVDCGETVASADQFCVALTNGATGEPVYAASGDIGAPIFNVQVRNNVYIYNMYGILSLPMKNVPGVSDPTPYGTGCSVSNIVAVTDLRKTYPSGYIKNVNMNMNNMVNGMKPIERVPLQKELMV